jgi:cell wall-associated NlpC family hydrolase
MGQLLLPTKGNLIKIGIELANTPYLWAGKGTHMLRKDGIVVMSPYFGLDCSGFITFCTKKIGGPDLRWTYNTDTFWNRRPSVAEMDVQPGDYALYGGAQPDDVEHVMLVLGKIDGKIAVIGASGGGHETTTLDKASQQDARVKVKTTHLYRTDFRGFRLGLI